MTIFLNWKSQKDDIYGKIHYAKIWQNYSIEIRNDGENFFDSHLLNERGFEIKVLFGAKTLKKAKQKAEEWVKQQIQPLILETP
jgi:hypothetical protein